MQQHQCGLCCVQQGNFGCWRSPVAKGTFVPLPLVKIQQPQWVNLDFCQWYHWHLFKLIHASRSDPGKGLGYGAWSCYWSYSLSVPICLPFTHPYAWSIWVGRHPVPVRWLWHSCWQTYYQSCCKVLYSMFHGPSPRMGLDCGSDKW